jgi:hypothetical protein
MGALLGFALSTAPKPASDRQQAASSNVVTGLARGNAFMRFLLWIDRDAHVDYANGVDANLRHSARVKSMRPRSIEEAGRAQ